MLIVPSRRGFLLGLAAGIVAPAIVRVENLMKLPAAWARRTVAPLWMPPSWLDPELGLADLANHGMSQALLDRISRTSDEIDLRRREGDRRMADLVLNYHDYDPGYARDLCKRIVAEKPDRVGWWS